MRRRGSGPHFKGGLRPGAGWPISFARRRRASRWGTQILTSPIPTAVRNEFEFPISLLPEEMGHPVVRGRLDA